MNQENIGKFIKNIRKQNNLTQEEFAKKFGVTYQAVSKWENGKNIPDIAIIKEISKEFNVDISEIINGKKLPKKKKLYILLILIVLIIIVITAFLIIHFHKDNFEFKQITTTCDNFNIKGSMAYNKDKTAIYISDVDYCGKPNDTIYSKITCNLYENYENTNAVISSCERKDDISLDNYLKDINITVDNYSAMCRKFDSSSLYLEINAEEKDGKITTYKIPIELNDNC